MREYDPGILALPHLHSWLTFAGCRKGKRECVYPEPPAARSSSAQDLKEGSGPSQQTSPTSSRDGDEEEMDQDIKLGPIMDEDESQAESVSRKSIPNIPPRRSSTTSSFSRHPFAADPRHGSETPSLEGTKSSSPSVSTGANSSLTPAALQVSDFPSQAGTTRPDWSFLPQELQFYLNHFYENITHYHYCMVNDSDDFFRAILPNIAVRNEALLYAIVGFSAYHHTLRNPNGQIKEFLQYYNRSVTLLLAFLKRKEKHNIGTLLTILQLATIEVGGKPWPILPAGPLPTVQFFFSDTSTRNIWETGSASWATRERRSRC